MLLLGAVGCGGDGEVIDCAIGGSASAQVGGGTDSTGFVVLQSGDPITVSFGPQGLYMVTPSVRVQNMYPGKSGRVGNSNDPRIEFELLQGSTTIGGSARENLGLDVSTLGAERLGVFTPFTPDISTYINQTITIKVTVNDACGRSASDSIDVVAQQ